MTESLFAAGGYNTPPASSPFLPVSPFEIVAHKFQQAAAAAAAGSVAFSQANSIFVQSQTDYLSGISAVSKKTETCFGRWEHSSLEPLHIQVPPIQPLTNLTIKSESISCGSSRSSKFEELTPHHYQPHTPVHGFHPHHHNPHHHHLSSSQLHSNVGSGNCGSGGLVTTMTTSSPSTTCMPSSNDLTNGCSRTIPISWSATSSAASAAAAIQASSVAPSSTSALLGSGGSTTPASPFPDSHTHHHSHASSNHVAASSSAISSSSSSCTLLQIKREPCQVSEVTTSNNLGHHHHQSHQPVTSTHNHRSSSLAAIVKIESSSPKSTVMDNHSMSTSQNTAGAIPVGIAVARQRLQEHTTVSHQPKEVNRFGIGIADIGGATSSLSSNMFFTGTNSTMIPLTSDALTMGVSNVQNAVRTPPTLWQYPTPVPVESMLPMPMPPVGFQLVRDPSTGQFLFLPTAATIGFSIPEPFQQAVVWPTYPQATAAIQPPHLLLPPLTQPIQPPPLAPLQLLGSDYLTTASTTLHQHTQTHSTRLVALTSDTKRKTVPGPTIPLPIPHHAVIKIEDCSSGSSTTTGSGTTSHHHHHHQAAIFGEEKSAAANAMHAAAATITTAVQTSDMTPNIPPPQLYYHQPQAGLIQIAPSHSQATSPLQSSSSQECRAIGISGGSDSPPQLAITSIQSSADTPPPSHTTTTSCLTPPPEHIAAENLDTSISCVPEVQDATIQTDTPVMSEDDNTIGAEECSLPSQTSCTHSDEVIREPSLVLRPSSTSPTSVTGPVCHIVSSNSAEVDYDCEDKPQDFSGKQSEAIDSSLSRNNDSGFDSNAVTSTNSLEEPLQSSSVQWNSSEVVENEEEDSTPPNLSAEISTGRGEHQFKVMTKVTSTPVDLSGLELLSNISIEAFENKVSFIKKEPLDENRVIFEPESSGICHQNESLETKPTTSAADEMEVEKFSGAQDEQLGGLNLLCALAEQRIQEEVGQRRRKRSSSSSDSHGSKKKKHKHSKSSKKSRHDKEKKDRKRHRHSEEGEVEGDNSNSNSQDDSLGKDFKETLIRVKAKYTKCSSCKGDGSPQCCREKYNWPTPEELISAMETDMRLRLADITRQCQEKKRELDEIAPILQQRKNQLFDTDSTPLSSKNSLSRAFQEDKPKFSTPPALSPNLFSESHMSVELPKISSDTESSKFEDVETSSSTSSKRKAGNPRKNDDGSNTETIVAKKPKSLVGYILASKNRLSESAKDKQENVGFFTTDEASVFSESSSCKLRASAFKNELSTAAIKQEVFEDENAKPIPDIFPSMFSDSSSFTPEKKTHRKSSKHHSKHKKSKNNKERKHRSSELKERKRKIDNKCILTQEHLDKEKTRVLTAMGGLFYAGCLTALQPPDVYAVTLDGERGNRPHIMSREEILRDAILEVAPTAVAEIPPGTRLCAYWSQQYRCLYPGTAAEPGTPDPIHDRKFVCVEFDDGDSGRIALEDIRFLLSDYPIVEYDPNPLLSLGKRKRRTSHTVTETVKTEQKFDQAPSTSTNCFSLEAKQSKNKHGMDNEMYREKRRLKKIRKDRLKKLEIEGTVVDGSAVVERKHKRKHKCNDELCKHRKHKKRRKHKKHHHRDINPTSADSSQDADYSQDASPDADDDIAAEQEDSVSQNGDDDDLNEEQEQMQDDGDDDDDKEDESEEHNEESAKKSPEASGEFNPNLKEDTMTEEEVASSITESSGSIYQEPGKKKERQNSADNHSKIAAFLPARQLWAWSGKGYKRSGAKGRMKKQFYKTIQRGKETITIGDSAVFLSTGRPDRPYIGRIESMWETSSSNKVVRVKWFYHPEETKGCPNLKFPGALFESPHEDENDVQTISHKCEVLPLDAYTGKFGLDPKQYQSIYDNNDTYYLAGHYDPTGLNLKLQPNIPTLATDDKWA